MRHPQYNVLHQRYSDPELAAIICHVGAGRGKVQRFIRDLVLREVRYEEDVGRLSHGGHTGMGGMVHTGSSGERAVDGGVNYADGR